VRIPNHVRPGQHVGGIVAKEPTRQVSSTAASKHAAIQMLSQQVLGVLINLPGSTVERLEAHGMSYDTGNNKQLVFIHLANTGTQVLHPSGSLKMLNTSGQVLQSIPLKMNAILPQTAIAYPVYMQHKALVPGQTYKALLSLKYEHNHRLRYTAEIRVLFTQKDTGSRIVSNLIAAPDAPSFFSQLTPWHYAAGAAILFLLLSALFFWCQRLYNMTSNVREKAAIEIKNKIHARR
jgi:hypothetical protein